MKADSALGFLFPAEFRSIFPHLNTTNVLSIDHNEKTSQLLLLLQSDSQDSRKTVVPRRILTTASVT